MFIVKVTAETIDQVVAQCKYASEGKPKRAEIGDYILIALSNIGKDEKAIKYIMRYDGFYEDVDGESKEFWGKQWKYIIKGVDIQPVIPFNMSDIQVRVKPYTFNMGNYLYVDQEDEVAVLKWAFSDKDSSKRHFIFPDELPDDSARYREGTKKSVVVNAYERKPKARQECVNHYGHSCFICGFGFGKTYGKDCDGMIHVHHITPLSEIGSEYTVDPIKDLRPVCPNCHMVLHGKKEGCYTIDDVKAMLKERIEEG